MDNYTKQAVVSRMKDLCAEEFMKTLIAIRWYFRRYLRSGQIEVGGYGWEDPQSTFGEHLGADVRARWSSLEAYSADVAGRKKLAEQIRADSIKEIYSRLFLISPVNHVDAMNMVGMGFESIGGLDEFFK